jgi:hypothetical protein
MVLYAKLSTKKSEKGGGEGEGCILFIHSWHGMFDLLENIASQSTRMYIAT